MLIVHMSISCYMAMQPSSSWQQMTLCSKLLKSIAAACMHAQLLLGRVARYSRCDYGFGAMALNFMAYRPMRDGHLY
jgi:hypothetical protein